MKRQRGFTLVEMMVGLTLLGVFMTGILGSVRLSTLLAESTIYESTSVNVAQGYLEQIKSLPYEDLLLAVQDPATFKIETISPSLDTNQQATVFDAPLSLEANMQPNERTVTIDVRSETNTVIEMPMRMWVTIVDRNSGATPINALEIKIRFAYQMPPVFGSNWREGQVQAIRARM